MAAKLTKSIKRLRKLVKVDNVLVKSVAEQEYYQIDWNGCIRDSQEAFGGDNDSDENGSFTKAAKDPKKAENFWAGIAKNGFGINENFLEPISVQLGRKTRSVEQIFLPENTQTRKSRGCGRSNAQIIVNIFNANTPEDTLFVLVAGGERIFGKKVNNRNAQKLAKRILHIYPDKNIIFVCAKLAQRSFSVSEIDIVHLMYDNGSTAGADQKGSRAKTANYGQFDKIAKIVSWSIDPERDSRFDDMMLEEAMRYKEKHGVDIETALRQVALSFPLFRTASRGKLRISPDVYLEELLGRNAFSSICRKRITPSACPADQISIIIEAYESPVSRTGSGPEKNPKGATFADDDDDDDDEERSTNPKGKESTDHKKVRQIAQEFMDRIVPFRLITSNPTTFVAALAQHENDEQLKKEFLHFFGHDIQVVRKLYHWGVLPKKFVDLQFELVTKK